MSGISSRWAPVTRKTPPSPTSARRSGRPRNSSAAAADWPASTSISMPVARPYCRASSAGVPRAISRPCSSTATWSHSRCASTRLCVHMKTVWPRSRLSRATRSLTWRAATGSRPDVGSSRNSTSGSCNRVRASAMRCRMPLLYPPTRVSAASASSNRASSSSTRRVTCARGTPYTSAKMRRMSRPVRRSSSDGVSVSTPVRRRSAGPSTVGSRPSTRAWPAVGLSTPLSSRTVVVLPAPLCPSTPKMAPGGTSSDRSSTARTSPKRRPSACARMTGSLIDPALSHRPHVRALPGEERLQQQPRVVAGPPAIG